MFDSVSDFLFLHFLRDNTTKGLNNLLPSTWKPSINVIHYYYHITIGNLYCPKFCVIYNLLCLYYQIQKYEIINYI